MMTPAPPAADVIPPCPVCKEDMIEALGGIANVREYWCPRCNLTRPLGWRGDAHAEKPAPVAEGRGEDEAFSVWWKSTHHTFKTERDRAVAERAWIDGRKELTAERDALAERVGKLQAVVDKLPKTVDGVPIVPGMVLFRLDSSPRRAIWISDCSVDVEGRDR